MLLDVMFVMLLDAKSLNAVIIYVVIIKAAAMAVAAVAVLLMIHAMEMVLIINQNMEQHIIMKILVAHIINHIKNIFYYYNKF